MSEPERRGPPAPILLGIAGHTLLRSEDLPALAAAIRLILEDLRTRYASRPLVVVSSLAEGADQLGAEVALAAGIEVVAPLPFPTELYRTRFRSPDARRNLERLVRHPAVKSFCPGESDGTVPDFTALLADNRRRKQRYADTAIFLARNSHALIAVWDGVTDASASLTAQLISFKTRGHPTTGPVETNASSETGIVFSIYAPRAGTVPTAGQTPGQTTLVPPAGFETASQAELFRTVFSAPRSCTLLATAPPKSTRL